jgi:hypothetical protein
MLVAKIATDSAPISSACRAPVMPSVSSSPWARKIWLFGLASEVSGDRAAVNRGGQRTVLLLPALHHQIAVRPIAVGDADENLRVVAIHAGAGSLSLAHGAEVFVEQLPRPSERRIVVDDLLDGKHDVRGQGLSGGAELAGVVGQLTDRYVTGLFFSSALVAGGCAGTSQQGHGEQRKEGASPRG